MTSGSALARALTTDAPRFHGFDAGMLWLGWEAPRARISHEERPEAEAQYAELLVLEADERGLAIQSLGSASFLQFLLEKTSDLLVQDDPEAALATAQIADSMALALAPHRLEESQAIYRGRAKYLAGTALRLLGRLEAAESAFSDCRPFLSSQRFSLDWAFWWRGLALLRWERGGLDEAGALLERATTSFVVAGLEREAGATCALLGLLAAEEGLGASAAVELRIAKATMNLEHRPWLSIRACLALALLLAGRKRLDASLTVLQEVWRLRLCVTDSRESVVHRWWEGRVQARLGNRHDAGCLLRRASLKYLEERRVPEAALVTLDTMLASAVIGQAAEAYEAVGEFEHWLGRAPGADMALQALSEFRSDLSRHPKNLWHCAAERAAALRRGLRSRGFRIDPFPFV